MEPDLAPTPDLPTVTGPRWSARHLMLAPFALAPVLLAANALWHPDDATGVEAYHSVAASPARWYLAHLAGAVGAALAVPLGATLVRWARAHRARAVGAAGWLIAVGAFGFFAEQIGHGLLMSALVSGELGAAASAPAWDAFVDMPESLAVGFLSGFFLLGFVVLAVALLRRRDVPNWWGVSLLAFVGLSMAAQTSGPVWLLFGALFAVPVWLTGRRVAADLARGG